MAIFTVTKQDALTFKSFFPKDIYKNIGKNDYYTLASLDDEDFIAGVLQFFVGYDAGRGTYSKICYLYVPEEFSDSDTTSLLLYEYENILSGGGIAESNRDTISEDNIFAYSCNAESFALCESIKDVKTRDIYSVSFIDDAEFLKIKEKVEDKDKLLQKSLYEEEISSFYSEKDGCGLLLTKKDSANTLVIDHIEVCSQNSIEISKALLSYSVKRALDQYGKGQIIRIECADYTFLDKLKGFIPEITPSLSDE